MMLVFFVSAVLHELVLGVPLHMVRFWAFGGIMMQVRTPERPPRPAPRRTPPALGLTPVPPAWGVPAGGQKLGSAALTTPTRGGVRLLGAGAADLHHRGAEEASEE
jgi:hypothetical protein